MGLPDIDNIPETGAVFTLGRSRFADNIASHFFIRKDPVVSIACGDEHSAVVCQSGRLFVFGSNDWGQLGLGHKNHVSKPSCVKSLKPEKVTHVACGRVHTLICTDGQKIFACGSDQESQLGRAHLAVGDCCSSPVMIYDCGIAGPRVVQIAAGSHHSLLLTSDGGVLAWGSNLEGQLGLHGISGLINTPTKVHIPESVRQISAGYYHSAFLTESGTVYVCGEAESGKLGIVLDFRTQLAPKQMSLSVKAAHVACGGHHTLVLGEDGNIYATGSNASGQLGMGTSVTEIQTPKQVPRDGLQNEDITKLVCGESHIAVVTGSGKLFTCGDGRHGKLGLEENENNVHQLTCAIKYQELFVTNVACGGCHTILVGRRREMENGDDESKQMKITPLPPLKVPVSRIQNDAILAKPDGPNIGNDENENSTLEKSDETNDETPMNNVDKPESPIKSSDYEESEEQKVKEDEVSNEKNENNNKEEMKPEDTENHNSTEETKATEVTDRPKSSVSRKSQVLDEIATVENGTDEQTNEENSNEEIMNEEPTAPPTESPPLPVPPPKPPRQKTGSAGSGSSSGGKSSSRTGSAKQSIGEGDEKAEEAPPEDTQKNEDEEKKSDASEKKSAGSEKSQSNQSKAESNETVPIEATIQNSLDQIENMGQKAVDAIDAIEEKIDIAADDADVVHSPPPRVGKISKLFNLRRPEVENGNKLSSSPNPKAKSKTCNIL